jgi:energy-coupling factor transporter ATP-binding protein EcfA2
MRVIVDGVSKTYVDRAGRPVHALDGIDLSVESEEFAAVLGPSGCSKSTLLNLIAGLLTPSAGTLWLDGKVAPGRAATARVFQEFALFPWRTVQVTAIVVHKDLHEAGVRTVAALKGKRIAVTQLGSTFHYQLGNILEKDGMSLKDVTIVPLQAMPAALEALKGKQVDAVVLPQPFPGRAEADGFGRVIAWAGDLFPWQIATVFYSRKFAADKIRAVSFMKGYVKSSRHYYDAVLAGKAS